MMAKNYMTDPISPASQQRSCRTADALR